jgi:hypothetical protein
VSLSQDYPPLVFGVYTLSLQLVFQKYFPWALSTFLEWFSNSEFDLVFSKSSINFNKVREKRSAASKHFHLKYQKGDRGRMDCQKGATKVDVIYWFFNNLLKE